MKFTFDVSLTVLNHLGRNLYRNITTVLAEAISNSWDADATNVWISIDRKEKTMRIKDDGLGMSREDFQNKFLRIGYSKRKDGDVVSSKGRPYIGRKGIGKLALLSCANRITVVSKKEKEEPVGGIIDNSDLDLAISEDRSQYELESADNLSFIDEHGTEIVFEGITDTFINTIDFLKKALALSFTFSTFGSEFNIFLNDVLIDQDMLADLAQRTQYCWVIDKSFTVPYIDRLACEKITVDRGGKKIRGFIASVKKPRDVKILGTKERVTIDLFVNGRLREKNILRHIPTARVVEDYVYGQIHCDFLDTGGGKDLFTSSREGVQAEEPEFQDVLEELEDVFRIVMRQWDELRIRDNQDGDPDNPTITLRERKVRSLVNHVLDKVSKDESSEFSRKKTEKWVKKIRDDADFNVDAYLSCFLAENLLRTYVDERGKKITDKAKNEADKHRGQEKRNKERANLSIEIRKNASDLSYLSMGDLAALIDSSKNSNELSIQRSADVYKPLRDAVGHTAFLTKEAKELLQNELENIKSRLRKLNESDR